VGDGRLIGCDHSPLAGFARYKAKAFRIKDSRQNRDAMAILLFKGRQALRSCRKSDL